ncbi:TlpA family protein disulfide reductase [Nocardioides sp. zg-ZUI104]|uniref:TlpA family protein disulfide reductase n=1 Tax=Nocardioides faecalis TaxID=2803858 RepID=UPI001BCB7953|nr:TlpA disulfide reductase family protein [Nocardioides faecalis]MBS4752080.1 TlpA family protein disulfide reductase [Nocardioides faecalis]
MRRIPAALGVLLAAAVLLTGCDGGRPAALACKVDVDTPDLVADREAAGIASCTAIPLRESGSADLPDVDLPCLGADAPVSLSSLQGPALVNFWASNCGPCREELPALQEFHERYGDQVSVLGVDYLETYPGAAIDLARRSGVTYPSLADACGDLADTDLRILGLPQFVLVAEDGSIAQSAGGVESVEEVVALVRTHLDIELAPAKGER